MRLRRSPGEVWQNARVPGPLRVFAAALILAGAVAGLYWQSVGCALTADDFQWLQHARAGTREPLRLASHFDTIWRPLINVSLAVEVLMWDRWMPGYRVSNLVLHVLAALALYGLARRCDLGVWSSLLVATVWALSPFVAEPACQVSSRVENVLLICWAGLLALWPRPEERVSTLRALALGGLVLAAAVTKETWVVTPVMVLAASWGLGGRPLRRALRPALVAAVPVVVYALVYALVFSTDRGVYRWSLEVAAKLPHQIAAFCHLEELVPISFPLTAWGVFAVVGVGGLGWWLLSSGVRPAAVALALLVLPTLPTLFVPYLPTRYTAIPYAGFVLVCALGLRELARRLPEGKRWVLVSASCVVVTLVVVAGLVTVRGDLRDLGRVAALHEQLLNRARPEAARFPIETPVVFVRAERENPLVPIAETPQGLLKLYYVRSADPLGLIDIAALFDWVILEPGVHVRNLPDDDPRAEQVAPVLAHRSDGFVWLAPRESAAATLAFFRDQGMPAKLLLAERTRS